MKNSKISNSEPIQSQIEYFWSTPYYNGLPDYIFGEKILEIGARDGTPQLQSRHRARFLSSEYLGLDIIEWGNECQLDIRNIDVFNFDINPNSFDLILSIHTLEHISFEHWIEFFDRCRQWTKPGGYVVVIVPDNQLLGDYVKDPDYKTALNQVKEYKSDANIHRVFSITPPVFKHFLLGCQVYRKKARIVFRDPHEKFWRPFGRFIKRLLTFHPYVWRGILRKKHSLMVIWRKPI